MIMHLFLLLSTTKAQSFTNRAQTHTTKQLVNTQSTQNTIDETTKAKTIQQLTDQSQNTTEQQTDSSQDLEQWLGEQTPKWVQLLLCMRHVLKSLLGIIDSSDNSRRELLQTFGDTVLLGRSFTRSSTCLGLSSDVTIWI